jgi:hypothetical protein
MTQLSALYARFDAIAKGSENGNGSAAHGAILERSPPTGAARRRRTGVPDLVREP